MKERNAMNKDREKKMLIMLTGLPGSGKTTTARKIMQSFSDFRIVSGDAIRTMIHGGDYIYSIDDEPYVFGLIISCAVSLLNKYNVIIDDAAFAALADNRLKLLSLLSDDIETCVWHCFSTLALDRRIAEPRGLPAERWKQATLELAERNEPITSEERWSVIKNETC